MKKKTLISIVLAAALLPAVGMSAKDINSFEKDAQSCDSWTWQGDKQSDSKQNTITMLSSKERIAFGDHTHYGIGW